eukprot:1156521-Pelagomonas_calceolata.AAC.9
MRLGQDDGSSMAAAKDAGLGAPPVAADVQGFCCWCLDRNLLGCGWEAGSYDQGGRMERYRKVWIRGKLEVPWSGCQGGKVPWSGCQGGKLQRSVDQRQVSGPTIKVTGWKGTGECGSEARWQGGKLQRRVDQRQVRGPTIKVAGWKGAGKCGSEASKLEDPWSGWQGGKVQKSVDQRQVRGHMVKVEEGKLEACHPLGRKSGRKLLRQYRAEGHQRQAVWAVMDSSFQPKHMHKYAAKPNQIQAAARPRKQKRKLHGKPGQKAQTSLPRLEKRVPSVVH